MPNRRSRRKKKRSDNTRPAPDGKGRRRRYLLWAFGVVVLVGGALLVLELRTSTLQARFLSSVGRRLQYEVADGPSPRIRFPSSGPYDQRLGYTAIPRLQGVLDQAGFHVTQQARISEELARWVDRGLFPIYEEKLQGGLTLRDRSGEPFHRTPSPARVYVAFDSIPELVWRSLLFIENREFLDERHPRRNPAVEWDRLAKAVLEMGLRAVGSERNVPGGSTLATQLEKFRHSPEGRTGSAREKLRQMASASLRAYRTGPVTLDEQRRIVRDYLNSVPLAAQRGHGEVIGTADGLWAWYGEPFERTNHILRGVDLTPAEAAERPRVFREAVSLLVAHRRPSYYLAQEQGRAELRTLTDSYLRLMAGSGVVDDSLARAAQEASATPLVRAPERPPVPFVERKAADQLRTYLLSLLEVGSLYDLDRYDLTVSATLDMRVQRAVAALFDSLTDASWVRRSTFAGDRLLSRGDPAQVIYTFTLLETTPLGNAVRVQTDNYNGPLSLSQAGRLELGSTAKLRTLVTYLEVMAGLHARFSVLPTDSLARVVVPPQDRLARWMLEYLRANPTVDLRTTLAAAMQRTYSASPAERFATGGGVQTFSNFDAAYDGRTMTVLDAFRNSVNLPSVRVMRDIVQHYMYGDGSTARMLEDVNDPARQEYLARFADREGQTFLRQFYAKYRGHTLAEIMELLVRDRALGPLRTAYAFRAVAPDADLPAFASFLETHTPYATLTPAAVEALYRQSDPSSWTLNDLGYLARVHPLELWLVRELLETPELTASQVVERSADVRQEVYAWLFRTRRRNAQDQRIRTILELEAFQEIHRGWKRLGYPFDNIVPSFGTAIGSSGDRPLALAELVGIILNGGVRYPVVRAASLDFAHGTPFETRFRRDQAAGERVLDPVVAQVAKEALSEVVENGTARRVKGAVPGPDGRPLAMGGKTGTGDNRYRVFGPGGRLVESRAVNRTATFAFFMGDRWFGVVTAYVPGGASADYRFTSALPTEILRVLGPVLAPQGP